MNGPFNPRQLERIASGLEAQGVKVRATNDGWHFLYPSGSGDILHRTTSDSRGPANFKARVAREGFVWPLDRAFKKRMRTE